MEPFRVPDLKAPRFRPKVEGFLSDELITKFKEKHKRYADVDKKTFKNIIKKFHEAVYQEVINTRDGVELPEALALICITSRSSSKSKSIDYHKSKQYGVAVTNKNWDTDGKIAKILYSTYGTKYQMKNRQFWGFIAARNFKRAVAKSYPENWTMYKELNFGPMHWEYKNDLKKKRVKEYKAKEINSFDL